MVFFFFFIIFLFFLFNNLKRLFDLDQLRNAVVHLFDSLVFCETHTPLVGDIIYAAFSLSVLTSGSTDLEEITDYILFSSIWDTYCTYYTKSITKTSYQTNRRVSIN